MPRPAPDPAAPRPPHGPLFWGGLLVGGGLAAFGLFGAWLDRADTHPGELVLWLAGAGIVHDAVLAPIFIALALLTAKLPAPARSPVRIGLAISGCLTAIAWPLVRRWGASVANPSALPLDYGPNLALVLAVGWLVVLFAVLIRMRGARRSTPAGDR